MNQVAIVFGLIVTAIVGIGAYTALAPLVTESENRNMEAELINVIKATAEYKWVNRNEAAALTALAGAITELVDNGYLDNELYNDGVNESVIGTNIEATAGAVGANATVDYDAGDEASCQWLLQRGRSGSWPHVDVNTDPTCATAALTVTLDY